MRHILLLALACIGAAPAQAATLRMGDVEIVYDEDRWDVSPAQPRADVTHEGALFFCTAPECRKRPFVGVTATPVDALNGRECAARKLRDAIGRFRAEQPAAGGGLSFTMITTHGGCRAYTPAHRRACATDDRFNYTLRTGSHFGCGGIEGVPKEMLAELIAGIRPVPVTQTQPGGDR